MSYLFINCGGSAMRNIFLAVFLSCCTTLGHPAIHTDPPQEPQAKWIVVSAGVHTLAGDPVVFRALLTAAETCQDTPEKEKAACLALWKNLPSGTELRRGEVEARFPEIRVRITKEVFCTIINLHPLATRSSCDESWEHFVREKTESR